MHTNGISIGIDLGTTNSLVSYYENGESIIIPNSLGGKLTPSVVSVLDNGEIVIGQAAKERIITYPHLTASLFKRQMGSRKEYNLGKYKLSPSEISSLIIKSLVEDVEKYLGKKVKEAVISVPAYFNDYQRKATIEAGRLAGINVERLISEPTAAALAYGLQEKDDEVKFLIFDLGGGTFDISVIDLFSKILEVRAVSGNNYLGGEDFDDILLQYFYRESNLNPMKLDTKLQANLKRQAELAKIGLSEFDKVKIECTIDDEKYMLEITEEKFEDLCTDMFQKLRSPIKQALQDSKIKTSELDYVILVGGSTKMRIIRSFVAKIFGKYPLSNINPDQVVAIGAGIAAAMKERNEELKENIMTDVCPFTLGTSVCESDSFGQLKGNIFLPIIERNTTIPYSKEVDLVNAYDNQTQIRVLIYQGESRNANSNLLLGELFVEIEPGPRDSQHVRIRYTYDLNGILEVEVTTVKTGVTVRKVILSNSNSMSEEEIQECLNKLKNIKVHPRENAVNRFLLEKAERLYQENLDVVRAEISKRINDFESILDRQIQKEIDQYVKDFEKFLNNIEDMGF